MIGYEPYIASIMNGRIAIIAACLAGAWASSAIADPCEGALPSKGTAFSGVVRSVGMATGCASVPSAGQQAGSKSFSLTSTRRNCMNPAASKPSAASNGS